MLDEIHVLTYSMRRPQRLSKLRYMIQRFGSGAGERERASEPMRVIRLLILTIGAPDSTELKAKHRRKLSQVVASCRTHADQIDSRS